MIELAEVIGELRRELQAAMHDGEGEELRFELGPVELEATVVVEKGGGGGAKVRFWVIELGGDAKASEVGRRGSGYRIGAEAVLTAAHVVRDANAVRVRFDADRSGEWGGRGPSRVVRPGRRRRGRHHHPTP